MVKRVLKYSLFAIIVLCVTIVLTHSVERKPTDEDVLYLESLFGKQLMQTDAQSMSYENQLQLVMRFQQVLHDSIKMYDPIPYNQLRNPKELIEFGNGWCYDLSYVLEKAFRHIGFDVRHVALYSDTDGFVKTLTNGQGLSHSLTEVRTHNGWLLVEPTLEHIWVSNDNSAPLSARGLRNEIESGTIIPIEDALGVLYPLYAENYFIIYGLYSRHGRFHPPFTPIPDVNFRELFYN